MDEAYRQILPRTRPRPQTSWVSLDFSQSSQTTSTYPRPRSINLPGECTLTTFRVRFSRISWTRLLQREAYLGRGQEGPWPSMAEWLQICIKFVLKFYTGHCNG